ncbi:cytochrome P450 [Massilia sp. YMA4]|uniref:cytochrome P450 n=1 Tax=Massilia sp. YMA4 TaxID=1593482 RepID=UPI000DD1277C|nr:cytochrome P450 [Massilia sp. YMA4]AXA92347.1 cytochrome P450 [Massilia sp. YMA4]
MTVSAPPADALAAVSHPDPYPYYAALARQEAPFHDERLGLWVAAHPGTVRAVLAQADCRVRPPHEPVPPALAGPAGSVFGALARMNDGARHELPKAVLLEALAALPAEAVAAHVRRTADALLVQGVALTTFAFELPVRAVASLLGCTDPAVAGHVRSFVAGLAARADAAAIAAAHDAVPHLLALADDIESDAPLLRAVQEAARRHGWTDAAALRANVLGLLSQTYEATAGLIGNGIVARLRGDARPAAALVDHVLRTDPPVQNTRRFTAADVDIAGVRIAAGQTILLVLAAAGEPFGHGRHACPGQALARAIALHALAALQEHGPLPDVAWRYRASPNGRLPEFIEGEGK